MMSALESAVRARLAIGETRLDLKAEVDRIADCVTAEAVAATYAIPNAKDPS